MAERKFLLNNPYSATLVSALVEKLSYNANSMSLGKGCNQADTNSTFYVFYSPIDEISTLELKRNGSNSSETDFFIGRYENQAELEEEMKIRDIELMKRFAIWHAIHPRWLTKASNQV